MKLNIITGVNAGLYYAYREKSMVKAGFGRTEREAVKDLLAQEGDLAIDISKKVVYTA